MSMPGETWAVVPAGGSGTRFSDTQDKLLADLGGMPVLIRTLQAVFAFDGLHGLVLVAGAHSLDPYQALLSRHLPGAPIVYATGGANRRESVYNGLLALPEQAEIVIIHDAARPLIRPEVIEQAVLRVPEGAAGAVVAIPVHDTVKQAKPEGAFIHQTIDRASLWRAQTPQVFRKQVILKAHQAIPAGHIITDDAQLLELAGLGEVCLVEGSAFNIKITTPEDLLLARALLGYNSGTD